jgi:hypothetical protein
MLDILVKKGVLVIDILLLTGGTYDFPFCTKTDNLKLEAVSTAKVQSALLLIIK